MFLVPYNRYLYSRYKETWDLIRQHQTIDKKEEILPSDKADAPKYIWAFMLKKTN